LTEKGEKIHRMALGLWKMRSSKRPREHNLCGPSKKEIKVT